MPLDPLRSSTLRVEIERAFMAGVTACRCVGRGAAAGVDVIYGEHDTKASLIAKGLCEADADELLRFRGMLPDMVSAEVYANLPPERKAEVRAYMLGTDAAAQSAEFRTALDRSIAESRAAAPPLPAEGPETKNG